MGTRATSVSRTVSRSTARSSRSTAATCIAADGASVVSFIRSFALARCRLVGYAAVPREAPGPSQVAGRPSSLGLGGVGQDGVGHEGDEPLRLLKQGPVPGVLEDGQLLARGSQSGIPLLERHGEGVHERPEQVDLVDERVLGDDEVLGEAAPTLAVAGAVVGVNLLLGAGRGGGTGDGFPRDRG